ncbi:MAG: glycosyltransferase, partial [Candidatus Eisenbacteria bacterium]|nr:glycosyltransferase [Candidatus Eisenbacteria bacterium]
MSHGAHNRGIGCIPGERVLKTVHIDTERTWRGGEQQALYLAQGLARRSIDVTMVGNPGSPFIESARRDGLPGFELPLRGALNPAAVFQLMQLFRDIRPDIVHAHSAHAHALGALAGRLSGIGRIVVSRRVDFSIHHAPLRLSLLKYRFGVDRFIAISEGVKAVMIRDGVPADKIDLVPSGVDIEMLEATPTRDFRSEFGIPESAPVVGDVAHFGWHKA